MELTAAASEDSWFQEDQDTGENRGRKRWVTQKSERPSWGNLFEQHKGLKTFPKGVQKLSSMKASKVVTSCG